MIEDLRVGSSHNDWILNPERLNQIVQSVLRVMERNSFCQASIDAIVCSGVSGAGVAFPLSMLTRIPVFIVRKEREQSHSSCNVECSSIATFQKRTLNYLVVDDFICSGATVQRILDYMTSIKSRYHEVKNINCQGLLLYMNHHENSSNDGYRDRTTDVLIPKFFCLGA